MLLLCPWKWTLSGRRRWQTQLFENVSNFGCGGGPIRIGLGWHGPGAVKAQIGWAWALVNGSKPNWLYFLFFSSPFLGPALFFLYFLFFFDFSLFSFPCLHLCIISFSLLFCFLVLHLVKAAERLVGGEAEDDAAERWDEDAGVNWWRRGLGWYGRAEVLIDGAGCAGATAREPAGHGIYGDGLVLRRRVEQREVVREKWLCGEDGIVGGEVCGTASLGTTRLKAQLGSTAASRWAAWKSSTSSSIAECPIRIGCEDELSMAWFGFVGTEMMMIQAEEPEVKGDMVELSLIDWGRDDDCGGSGVDEERLQTSLMKKRIVELGGGCRHGGMESEERCRGSKVKGRWWCVREGGGRQGCRGWFGFTCKVKKKKK